MSIIEKMSLILHPINETRGKDHVLASLEATLNITPLCIHEPNREEKTIRVDVSSKEDYDAIKEHGVRMKPTNVSSLYFVNFSLISQEDISNALIILFFFSFP